MTNSRLQYFVFQVAQDFNKAGVKITHDLNTSGVYRKLTVPRIKDHIVSRVLE